ncbi:hypothetical protein [Bogoriella caseilytica]|uniref:Uncharacterized protein n=1 Tax=Bogoriella caseilytica TaxID=56055 RepID=A0A3N2BBW7_9MICO|nr:hypothetical protein [Bogoriella caseilytica]ROR72759.1 hypothetical protein EDD31_1118 [Bogoriella caseilytica]
MTEHSAPILPLGQLPRPATGADLARRLHTALSRYSTEELTGLDNATIAATLDGQDIATLDIDLSGVAVDGDPKEVQDTPPKILSSAPAVVRRVTVRAHPIRIMGAAVDVRAEAEDFPIAWLEGADQSLWLDMPETAEPTQAFVRMAVNQDELLEVVRGHARAAASEAGVTLARLDVTLRSSGRRSVHVRGFAKIRKGVLSASARFRADLNLADDMMLSISKIKLSSGNPLVAVVLLFARNHIDTSDRRIDLNADMSPGLRVVDAGLETGTDLVLTARLG